MQDALKLKRDVFREGIRRQKIDKILTQKRKTMLEKAKETQQQQNDSYRQKIVEMISNIRRSPPNLNEDLRLVEHISTLNYTILNDPQILKYLADLTIRSRNSKQCEQYGRIQQMIGQALFRFIQTCPQMAMNNMNHIYPILQSPQIIFIHMEVARLNSQHIKQISFKLFLEALKQPGVCWQDASDVFRTYLTEKPKLPYSQAVAILDYFEVRLRQEQSEEEFINFLVGTLEVTSLQFHIDYLIYKESIVPNVMNRAKSVKQQQNICTVFKFLSNIFRGPDETSLKILKSVPNIYQYMYYHLQNNNQKIQTWVFHAICNFCANGIHMIMILFQNDTLNIIKNIYQRASHRLRFQIIFLIMIICRKGGDKYTICLYEYGLLPLLTDSLLNQDHTETTSYCLLCIKLFLLSASKVDSLGMKHTKEMVMSLERTIGLRDKLEELIVHEESRINEDARLILESYLNATSLF